MASATTISDGEDEDDDVFEMAEQLPSSSSRRQGSARPQTAGPGQRGPPSRRPATAPNEPQPRSEHLTASQLSAWVVKLTVTL